MLKKLLGLLILLSLSITSYSQHRRGSQVNFKESGKKQEPLSKQFETKERLLEVGLIASYQFGGKFYAYTNNFVEEIRISDGTSYGITASIASKWNTRVELAFSWQETSMYGNGTSDWREGVSIRYYQIGVIKEMPNGKIIPYGTISMGAVQIDSENDRYSDEWKFAITLGGGLKYYLTDAIGIKLEARMMAPISYGGLYLGTGGSGVSAGSATMQGYFGGGLTFALAR
ncbi:MAG: hypothetical protein KAH10_04280 [Flavobacteriales bacterium]|nr:hypothetical protein [Flavobacteriales bacterium]